MAADSGLRRLFEKPVPENPTLLEALSSSWNHRRHFPNNKDTASFTEIFGELHFQEKPHPPPPPPPPVLRLLPPPPPPPPAPAASSSWALDGGTEKSKDDSSLDALLRPRPAPVKRSASFCVKKTKSASASALLLCTEGLGSESTAVDVVRDDDLDEIAKTPKTQEEEIEIVADMAAKEKGKEEQRTFPPPIRSIASGGRGGKPSVCFRSFRAEGRFVLVEVVIPGKELLHASREGGRLRLQFAAAAANV